MDGVNSLSDSPSYAALYTSHATPSTRPLYATRQHRELRRKRSAGSNGVTSAESDDEAKYSLSKSKINIISRGGEKGRGNRKDLFLIMPPSPPSPLPPPPPPPPPL